ncbi:CRISPR-associated protein Cas4/endonuclease Cas1 fusion [Legionella birminghamensis]|uniref:CRISPR-associated exonuclease Cas4 n=1 Tax=Legionella birminghamensis TaxID=28083 RepID=A0A378IB28_9GAMM|nr:CRISPR-associated protein Cas4 [Legionella birminghamensis]KTC70107.1 CRISPR-associated protein Cas4/endonuclease Cas1 fusion [Legionella birminghamensis]STX32000.1 CRISPR-associated protein Cas4 [Legionella birminghamensis]
MDDYLPLSALQHYAFCPRQFALIHIEQVWSENKFTAEGRILHERVDSGEKGQRKNFRTERNVVLVSNHYKLSGKIDLLEVEMEQGQAIHFFPVEYKRGKPKVENWDRVQLCAQALCLEEMRGIPINEGAIWYWNIRRRVSVPIDQKLRAETIQIIADTHALLQKGNTPAPTPDKTRCKACSLFDICQPEIMRSDHSANYLNKLFVCDDYKDES